MGRKWVKWLEKWGYALMCVLCAGVVLLSALWTRSADQKETLSLDAARSMDEKLSDVQYQSDARQVEYVHCPADGKIVRDYSEKAVYFAGTGIWSAHPAIDFDAPAGSPVYAMFPGRVTQAGKDSVRIDHGDRESVYRGMEDVRCEMGAAVAAGDVIGTAGGHVPFEGEGHVCVSVYESGTAVDFAPLLP